MVSSSSTPALAADKGTLRFALPPSVTAGADRRSAALAVYLERALGRRCRVTVATSYVAIVRAFQAGELDAAWAPPFVCARIEQLGDRIVASCVRAGAQSYRAALVARAGQPLTLQTLHGKRAVWTDRNSVGGYLLVQNLLRSRGFVPAQLFSRETFAGSYRPALEAVLAGTADVTSVFAPPAGSRTGIAEIAPDLERELAPVAFTETSPNDGIAVAQRVPSESAKALAEAVLSPDPAGARLLAETFAVERFAPVPSQAYRALYRVALASF